MTITSLMARCSNLIFEGKTSGNMKIGGAILKFDGWAPRRGKPAPVVKSADLHHTTPHSHTTLSYHITPHTTPHHSADAQISTTVSLTSLQFNSLTSNHQQCQSIVDIPH